MATGVDLTDLNTALAHKQKQIGEGLGAATPSVEEDKPLKVWKPPNLADDFKLKDALNGAYKKALFYMNTILERDGLYVEMQQMNEEIKGVVREMDTNKQVREYNGVQILKLYAHNLQARGILVDGRV